MINFENYYFLCQSVVVSEKSLIFASALAECPDGGIGRRAGLKHQWGNPSRFDPGSGYKKRRVLLSVFFIQ